MLWRRRGPKEREGRFSLASIVDDDLAFRRWYDETAPRVYAYLYSRTGSQAVAEEMMAVLPDNAKEIKYILGDLEYNALRSQVLTTKKRVDGRATNEVRPISIDTGLLPRAVFVS